MSPERRPGRWGLEPGNTTAMWDLSCIGLGGSYPRGAIAHPRVASVAEEADIAVSVYDELQLPDVPGTPKMRTASGQWFRDVVRAAFGAWDPVKARMIRDSCTVHGHCLSQVPVRKLPHTERPLGLFFPPMLYGLLRK